MEKQNLLTKTKNLSIKNIIYYTNYTPKWKNYLLNKNVSITEWYLESPVTCNDFV